MLLRHVNTRLAHDASCNATLPITEPPLTNGHNRTAGAPVTAARLPTRDGDSPPYP